MNLLILGGNSDVAKSVAMVFAKSERADIRLCSRDTGLLETKARDIAVRCRVDVTASYFDATDYSSHHAFYDDLDPKPDVVVLAFGLLGDQKKAQDDFEHAKTIVESNFLGAVSILEIIASDFERRGHGSIIVLSSVAGERGRQSNYMYGASKGALSVYLSGLRNRLHKKGVQVITVLPGFIRTKMTGGMELPALLTSEPDDTARDIYKAFLKKKHIVYTKWYWRWIMRVIKSIPEFVFVKLDM